MIGGFSFLIENYKKGLEFRFFVNFLKLLMNPWFAGKNKNVSKSQKFNNFQQNAYITHQKLIFAQSNEQTSRYSGILVFLEFVCLPGWTNCGELYQKHFLNIFKHFLAFPTSVIQYSSTQVFQIVEPNERFSQQTNKQNENLHLYEFYEFYSL